MAFAEKLRFKFHGRWGGPNYSNGSYDPNPNWNGYSDDPLDEIYKKHDYDYTKIEDHGVADKLMLRRVHEYHPDSIGNFAKKWMTILGFSLKSFGSRDPTPEDIPDYLWERIKNIDEEMAKNKNKKPTKAIKKEIKAIKRIAREVKPAKRAVPRPRNTTGRRRNPMGNSIPIGPNRTMPQFKLKSRTVGNTLECTGRFQVGAVVMDTTHGEAYIIGVVPITPNLFSNPEIISGRSNYERYDVEIMPEFSSECTTNIGGSIFALVDDDPKDVTNYVVGSNYDTDLFATSQWYHDCPVFQTGPVMWKRYSKKGLWCQQDTDASQDRFTKAGYFVFGQLNNPAATGAVGRFYWNVKFRFYKKVAEPLPTAVSWDFDIASGLPQTGTLSGPLKATNSYEGLAIGSAGFLNFRQKGIYMFTLKSAAGTLSSITPTAVNCDVLENAIAVNGGGACAGYIIVNKSQPVNVIGAIAFTAGVANVTIHAYVEKLPANFDLSLLGVKSVRDLVKDSKVVDTSMTSADKTSINEGKQEVPDIEECHKVLKSVEKEDPDTILKSVPKSVTDVPEGNSGRAEAIYLAYRDWCKELPKEADVSFTTFLAERRLSRTKN